jgi:TolB-like protein/DNA-binding winged helix-turn-helix (wHTH) protein/Tfp pilus assembly protein PilF
MAATPPTGDSIRFGVFELDVRTGELRKRGLRLPIQGLPIQLLTVLLEQPNQLVTRDELRTRLWPSDTFVDFDHSLHNAVARLREVLGDEAGSPRFIETLPRRGYRFIGPVERIAVQPERVTPGEPRRHFSRSLVATAVGLIVLSALVGVAVEGVRSRLRGRSGATGIQSIAVLPLKSLSSDPAQDYFAEGLTEALITDLGKVSALRVISRTSVMRYKDTRKTLPEIARELHVDALVEGTVTRSGDRVRITANLVQGSPEKHLWSESYERSSGEVLRLQRDVAQAIVHEIRVALTPHERSRLVAARAVDPEVYQLYLRGRFFWNRRTPEGLGKAIDAFERVIEREPGYAPAYAGLADAYIPMAYLDFLPPREAHVKAKRAALAALKIDESLAEAHASLAATLEFHDRDWVGAEREFKRAIELNPNYATAHHWYAQLLAPLGRTDECLAESRKALDLDPLSLIINGSLGNRLYLARQFDRAIEQLHKTLELDSSFDLAHWNLGEVHEAKRAFPQAIAAYTTAATLSRERPAVLAALARAHALSGNRELAWSFVDRLKALSQSTYVSPFDMALVHVGLGMNDEAFAWLDKAYDDRSNRLVFIAVDPKLDALRADPRFDDLLRRMGLRARR